MQRYIARSSVIKIMKPRNREDIKVDEAQDAETQKKPM